MPLALGAPRLVVSFRSLLAEPIDKDVDHQTNAVIRIVNDIAPEKSKSNRRRIPDRY
jgi:hypothetical protein